MYIIIRPICRTPGTDIISYVSRTPIKNLNNNNRKKFPRSEHMGLHKERTLSYQIIYLKIRHTQGYLGGSVG